MTRWPPLPADVAPVPGLMKGTMMTDKAEIEVLVARLQSLEYHMGESRTHDEVDQKTVGKAASTLTALQAQLAAAEARAEKAQTQAALFEVELERLREAIKIKGGTEHSPTEDAYNAACAAIRKHKDRAAAAEALLGAAYRAGLTDAANRCDTFRGIDHIAQDMDLGIFPQQSERQEAISRAIRSIPVPADLAARLAKEAGE